MAIDQKGVAEAGQEAQSDPKATKLVQPETKTAEAVWSSGVRFYPPSDKYWRIGGKWYDFSNYLSKHPGGAEALLLARDRFEDCTFVFESHHHNYKRARAVIKQYEVSEDIVRAAGLRARPTRRVLEREHHDSVLDANKSPNLLDDDAFYSVMRRRLTEHLKKVGCPGGGPTRECMVWFWVNFVVWACSWFAMWYTGSFWTTPLVGLSSAFLGAFGHNWVHQPRYKFWAFLSLDTIGFSSDTWLREHNLQHHMYTNTPWDNHHKGTDPFLVTDPTVERNWLQRNVTPYCTQLILCFGMWGNWFAQLACTINGEEKLTPGKLLIPLQVLCMVATWGLFRGFGLVFVMYSVTSNYYYTMALMNHNSEHSHDVSERNASKDWGIAQLNSSTDWGVQLNFYSAARYLWLNYHTVHHLFPKLDFSHHPAVQAILIDTAAEFGVKYEAMKFWDVYKEMIHSFQTPSSLMQEIIVYSGGL